MRLSDRAAAADRVLTLSCRVQYIILVLLPCLSHLGCCYIIISFWMDEVRRRPPPRPSSSCRPERSDETLTLGVVQECHTVMRTRTMWATVPLLLFFTCQMMRQSTHYNWLDCSQEALVQQICYLQVTPRAAAAPLSSTPRC